MSKTNFTPEEAAQIAVEYARKRVNDLAKSLAELRERELSKAMIAPRASRVTGTTVGAGVEDTKANVNPPGKLDAVKAEESSSEDSPHGKEETSGETSPEDMAKEELCKKCGKSHSLEKGCTPLDMEKAMLKDSKGREKDNGVHPDSVLPEDKDSKEVSADGSGGDIKKGKKLGKATPPMAKPPSGKNMGTHVPTSTVKAGRDMSGPKHRNIQHLHAKMKGGAGVHSDKRPDAGPSASDWEDTKGQVPGAFGKKPESSPELDKAALSEQQVKQQASSHMRSDSARAAVPPTPAAPVRPSPTPEQHAQRAAQFAQFTPPAATTGHRPGIFGRLGKSENLTKAAPTRTGVTQPRPAVKPAGAGLAAAGAPPSTGTEATLTTPTTKLAVPPVGDARATLANRPSTSNMAIPVKPVLTERPKLKLPGAHLKTAGAPEKGVVGDPDKTASGVTGVTTPAKPSVMPAGEGTAPGIKPKI